MISLTWNYNTPSNLIGCGIDGERVDRFNLYIANDERPMPFVFSGEEIKYFNQLSNPAKGFCSAFCCKEAFYKAVSGYYNFPECELLSCGDNPWQALKLSDALCIQFGIDLAMARIEFIQYQSYVECLAAVYVFKDK